jgi:DNA-binding transcriptional LysR family regulator
MMNLRNLEAFLAVSESLSFTQAAKRLHKTQSAVSQAVRQLEDELGVVLVDRSAGRVKLTGTGQQMMVQAQQLLDQLNRMTSLAREHQHSRLSELRFGIVDSFATAVGPTLISSLLKEAINLSLWSDLTPHLGLALLQRQVDIVVTNDDFSEHAALTRHRLLKEPFVLVLPSHISWNVASPDLGQLARTLPMISYHTGSFLGTQVEKQCRLLGAVPSRKVQVDSTEKLIAMVASGIGWCCCTPISLLRTMRHMRQVKVVPLPGPPLQRHLFMVSRRGELDELVERLANQSRRALLELLEESAALTTDPIHQQVEILDQ